MTAAETSTVVQKEVEKKEDNMVKHEASEKMKETATEVESGEASAKQGKTSPEDTGRNVEHSGSSDTVIKEASEAEKSEKIKPDTTAKVEDIIATKDSEDLGAEAKKHLTEGKRKMLVQDYVLAVESLQKACELLAAKYGDDASESAEALHYYGKALLELHRKETGALNDIDTHGTPDDDSSDEDDGDEKEEDEKHDQGKKESGTSYDEEGHVTEQSPKEEEEEECLEEDETANGSNKEAEEAVGDDDDVSNLQIAFEVLELAKKIYKRDAMQNPELYLKAADCLLALGEINLESDTYDRAVEDFEECLRIQQEMLPRDARVIAETNYQLGLTYSFMNNFEQSAAYYSDALQILKLKVSNLKEKIEEHKVKGTKVGSVEQGVANCAEEEIEEIQQLLPEIAAKIEDAKESMRDNSQGPKEKVIRDMLNRNPETSPEKKETKVNVISSSLIKRKRPLEGDAGGSSSSGQNEKRLKET